MTILVTIGPTLEPLDAMRILSNRSTGQLGTLLASSLARHGYQVIALRSVGSTASDTALRHDGIRIIPFTTTEDLERELEKVSAAGCVGAVFHAAAVADFHLPQRGNGKFLTNAPLTLTLHPTPKLLPKMQRWFPGARITGWKFEASGDRNTALAAAHSQIETCGTDDCVVNGPSYGEGFGLLAADGTLIHLADREALCARLVARFAKKNPL